MNIASINDFSERLSPVLVKELRQGMRTKSFVGIFLGLQILLTVLLIAIGISSGGDPDSGSTISGFIFSLFSFVLLIFQPLRGTNALHAEIKEHTIDMMVLTRLDAWGIVFGKWIAIAGQSALLLVTVFPYLLLRYFFGGMDLAIETIGFITIFLTSLALTAATIGLSGCNAYFIRGLVPLAGLLLLFFGFSGNLFSGSGGPFTSFRLSDGGDLAALGVYLVLITYGGYSALSMGASLIAPAAENHAVLRRFLALVLITAAALAGRIFSYADELHILLVFAIAVPAIIIALCESTPLIKATADRFRRYGPAGQLASWFFLPSWGSGVLFAIIMAAGAIAALLVFKAPGIDAEECLISAAFLGGLFFPAVSQAFSFRGAQRLAHYFILLVGSCALLPLGFILESSNSGAFLWLLAWHPFIFIPLTSVSGYSDAFLATALSALLLAYFLILVLAARKDFRRAGETMGATEIPGPSGVSPSVPAA